MSTETDKLSEHLFLEKMQPFVNDYCVAKIKIDQIRNRPPINDPFSTGELQQLKELGNIMSHSEKQILQIIFGENEEKILSILNPK